jgi:2-polyprenyl-3-methyl-5-hydroxy-6-metoxy-1,4-benzoquinol methylase
MTTEKSYDIVAAEYARRIHDELRNKPLDRLLLIDFAQRMGENHEVCDMGCGPGHVAGFLHQRGLTVEGLDISAAMIREARTLHPAISFRQGDMLDLSDYRGKWSGIVAFYSIIHITPVALPGFFESARKSLKPKGLMLLAFHTGSETLELTEWWGHAVDVAFYFHRTEEVEECLHKTGFDVIRVLERDPYPSVEHQSRRAYVLAQRA